MIDSSILDKIQIFTVSIGEVNYQPQRQSVMPCNNLSSYCNISRLISKSPFQSDKLINIEEEEKIQQTTYQGINRGLDDFVQTNTHISYFFNNQLRKKLPHYNYNNVQTSLSQLVSSEDFQYQSALQTKNTYQNLKADSSQFIEEHNLHQDQEQFILKRRNSRLDRLNEIKEKIKQKIKECKATCKLNQKQQQAMIINENEIKKERQINKYGAKNNDLSNKNLVKPIQQKNEQTGVSKFQNHQYNTRNHQKLLTLRLKQKEEKIKRQGAQTQTKLIFQEEISEIKSPFLLKKIKQNPINPENNLISRFEKNQKPVIQFDDISFQQNKRKTRKITAETAQKKIQIIQQQTPLKSQKKSINELQTHICKTFNKSCEKPCSNKQISQNITKNNNLLSSIHKKIPNQPFKQMNSQKQIQEKAITQNKYKTYNKSLTQFTDNDLEEKRPQQKRTVNKDKIDYIEDQDFDQIFEQKNKYPVQKKASQNLKSAVQDYENQDTQFHQIEVEDEIYQQEERDGMKLHIKNDFQNNKKLHQNSLNANYEFSDDDDLDEMEELELQQFENEIDQEGSFLDYQSHDFIDKKNKNYKFDEEISDCEENDDNQDEQDESSSSSDLSSYESFIENKSYQDSLNIDEIHIPTIYISSNESLVEVQIDQSEKIEKKENSIQNEEIPKLEIILENSLINQMKDIVLSNQLNNLKEMILQSRCDLLNLKCYKQVQLSIMLKCIIC